MGISWLWKLCDYALLFWGAELCAEERHREGGKPTPNVCSKTKQPETFVASTAACSLIQNLLTSCLENRRSDQEFMKMWDKDLQKCSLEHPLPGASAPVSFLGPSVTALLTVSASCTWNALNFSHNLDLCFFLAPVITRCCIYICFVWKTFQLPPKVSSATFRALRTYYGSRKMLLKFQKTSSLAFWDAKMLWLLQYLAEILSNIFVCHE